MSTWKKFPFAWIDVVVHRVVVFPSIAFPGVPAGDAVATHPVRGSAVNADVRCSTFPPAGSAVTGSVSVRGDCRHALAASKTIDREIQYRLRRFTISGLHVHVCRYRQPNKRTTVRL
ncbi:MAG TPA: hypothetical protein VN903_07820 [Polyangia bacterium]|jgi:hypothetical protein|nr:hypothetical protein [Polyangia bacterium]